MNNSNLSTTIMQFARLVCRSSDAVLDQPWTWEDYDEGVRFAFFRIFEELCELASFALAERRASGNQPTAAQIALAQYHTAFRDLQAILLGVDNEKAEIVIREGEWPLRQVLIHIVEAEGTFLAITNYAVERQRSSEGMPTALSDEGWNNFWAGDPYEQLLNQGSFTDICSYHEMLHERVIGAFCDVKEKELDAPSKFWESTPKPVVFRLRRFNSHMRQHSIHAEKILAHLDGPPSEIKRLLRLVLAALAEVEGELIGAPKIETAAFRTRTRRIITLTEEIIANIS